MPKAKLQRVILVAIATLIAAGGIVNFYVAPQWSKLGSQRARTRKLTAEIDAAQATIKSEALSSQLREQMRTFVEEQQTKMISGDPFSWVVREVTLVSERHPVRVSGLRPGNKINNSVKSRYEMFVTRMEVDGSYDQAGEFIKDLENAFPTGEVRSLELSATDPARGLCRVVFEFALLIRPDEPAPVTQRKTAS